MSQDRSAGARLNVSATPSDCPNESSRVTHTEKRFLDCEVAVSNAESAWVAHPTAQYAIRQLHQVTST